jgi:YidC/Oxa1 family membrane protein insertase
MSFFDSILWPIMVAVAWVMVQFHSLLTTLGLSADSGASWVLSIVGLVIVIRIVLIPLFVKQIKASRGLQLIQPQMQKLQAKYKGKTDPASRQAMQQEMMALYRDAGTNPFASCLPILAQSPVFFALFRVLYSLPDIANGTMAGRTSIGPLTPELATSAEQSTLFGAPLSSTFMRAAEFPAPLSVRIVSIVLIVLMSVTTFMTQRQLTMKNMPAAALDNPMARQQRMLMYILPLIFAVTGVNFPIGVLIYWFTTNLWTMGQQFYVIRRMPTPGSAAEAALRARRARRALRRGRPLPEEEAVTDESAGPRSGGQREQPRRKDRQRPAPGAAPGAAGQVQPGAGSQAPRPKRPRPPAPGTAGGARSTGAPGGARGARSAGEAGGKPRPRPSSGQQRGQSNTRSTGAQGPSPRGKGKAGPRSAPPSTTPDTPSEG